jgi:hypothetical protein
MTRPDPSVLREALARNDRIAALTAAICATLYVLAGFSTLTYCAATGTELPTNVAIVLVVTILIAFWAALLTWSGWLNLRKKARVDMKAATEAQIRADLKAAVLDSYKYFERLKTEAAHYANLPAAYTHTACPKCGQETPDTQMGNPGQP